MNFRPFLDEFKREILLVLVLKLALIYTIKVTFFSAPIDKHLTDEDVSRMLLNTPESYQSQQP